ncbi:MAG: gluconate transporter [Bacteroidetes bacterium]|nr:MAG: gluconate transporter [Bacteroidota bacterium]
MGPSFYQLLICLIAGIVVIILLTTKFRVHAFFALLIACFVTGLGMQMNGTDIVVTIKDGFGNIMKSLGLIIVLGTTLGVLLEQSGSTKVMANYILSKTGDKNAALAMSLTGFFVGFPVFCDSGYIVLSGLIPPLAKRTGLPVITLAASLATGLYSVHCLVPPHPGVSAAASSLGVDFGRVIGWGALAALPAMLVGYGWARFAGKKYAPTPTEIEVENSANPDQKLPSVTLAFLPIVVPVLLIAARSFISIESFNHAGWESGLLALGDPVIALSIGVLLCFTTKRKWTRESLSKIFHVAIEKAGSILVIIGAGGAFGAILAATKPGEHFRDIVHFGGAGILLSFLLTSILKTAQGSSTVAIITASSIVLPLLSDMGLDSSHGRLLSILAMGAGSMTISHANDAYFWVIVNFSGLDMKSVLKVYSVASFLMGLTTLAMVYLLSFILL